MKFYKKVNLEIQEVQIILIALELYREKIEAGFGSWRLALNYIENVKKILKEAKYEES